MIWDDWIRSLSDFQYEFVDAALATYLTSPESIDSKTGRFIRPAPARIRQLAIEQEDLARVRNKNLLTKQNPTPRNYRELIEQVSFYRANQWVLSQPVRHGFVEKLAEMRNEVRTEYQALIQQYPEISIGELFTIMSQFNG